MIVRGSMRSYDQVVDRMRLAARMKIESMKGYLTSRDLITVDSIVEAVAVELTLLGVVDDPVKPDSLAAGDPEPDGA